MLLSDTDAPQRSWALTNPRYTWDRTVHAALTAFRRTISQGRYTFKKDHFGREHAKLRMQERGVSMAVVLECVRRGRICTVGISDGYIGGAYLLDETLVIVDTPWPPESKFSDLVPEIGTVYKVNTFEPRPLTTALGELMAS